MTTLTNEQIVAELKWNELTIHQVTDLSPKYFRPPYGDIDNRVREVAAALGFMSIIWNYDINDWATTSESFQEIWIDGNVTQWAQAAKQAQAGGVSLEHDLYEKTVNAALRVLPILQKEYTLLPVGVCNRVEVYKNNSTATIAHSSLVPSSGVFHSSATAVLSSPATSPTSKASVAANIATGSGNSLVTSTAFGFVATMAILSLV